MKPDFIKRFEEMGLGLFVHYGLYSVVQKGEWRYNTLVTDKQKQDYFSLIGASNVVEATALPKITIQTNKKIIDACCYDNKKTKVKTDNKTHSFFMPAFSYGTSLHIRVIRFKLK